MIVYDGNGMILGRLATLAAKDALLGEEVRVVNCEYVIISGKKTNTFQYQKERYGRRGYPLKAPTLSRMPDRFVRRTIRGMLPWRQARGREVYRHVMCYVGVPAEFAREQLIKPKSALGSKLPTLNYVTVRDVCRSLGGKT
ncbi:MAG: 50S ribosomal protein L13 [Nanoarchaeota archaeon]